MGGVILIIRIQDVVESKHLSVFSSEHFKFFV
jgi:hypothetical protein